MRQLAAKRTAGAWGILDRHDLVRVQLVDEDSRVSPRMMHAERSRQMGLREEIQDVSHILAAAEKRPSVPAVVFSQQRPSPGIIFQLGVRAETDFVAQSSVP